MYLLDDPLAAVDAQVSKQIFKRYQRNGPRLKVTQIFFSSQDAAKNI